MQLFKQMTTPTTLTCDCGIEVSKKNLKRHQVSEKHKDLMLQRKKEGAPLSMPSGATKFSGKKDTDMKEGLPENGNHAEDKIKKKTKARFRIVLNEKYKTKEEFIKSQVGEETRKTNFPTRRLYGDFLYHQDRKLFDTLFLKWRDE